MTFILPICDKKEPVGSVHTWKFLSACFGDSLLTEVELYLFPHFLESFNHMTFLSNESQALNDLGGHHLSITLIDLTFFITILNYLHYMLIIDATNLLFNEKKKDIILLHGREKKEVTIMEREREKSINAIFF